MFVDSVHKTLLPFRLKLQTDINVWPPETRFINRYNISFIVYLNFVLEKKSTDNGLVYTDIRTARFAFDTKRCFFRNRTNCRRTVIAPAAGTYFLYKMSIATLGLVDVLIVFKTRDLRTFILSRRQQRPESYRLSTQYGGTRHTSHTTHARTRYCP